MPPYSSVPFQGANDLIEGLAYHQTSGTMFACTFDQLYSLNIDTGLLTLVGALGHEIYSLEFGPDGETLCGGGSDGNMYTIDTTTGAASLLGSLVPNQIEIGGLSTVCMPNGTGSATITSVSNG